MCGEIGVWKGDFSQQILDIVDPKVLHLIDPWGFQENYNKSMYGGSVAKNQKDMDGIFSHVSERFKNQIIHQKVFVHRTFSQNAAHGFSDHYFDWLYIDGNHTYEYVLKDLQFYVPKIKRGGFITGDDYCEGHWWQGGVKRAVDEFVRKDSRVGKLITKTTQFVLSIKE